MSSVNQKLEKEQELKDQHKLDKSEELQMDKEEFTEKDIKEICCMQEQHMNKLKENLKETNELKMKEEQCKTKFNEFEKELELLEEAHPDKSKKLPMAKKETKETKNSCRRNCNESCDNNICPECKGSKSFINKNTDVPPYSARDLDSQKTNEQREMRVVTPGTEADRARFGHKRVEWN